jgi:hypothetical protein
MARDISRRHAVADGIKNIAPRAREWLCKRATAMFGRASSRSVQKLETDPDIAIVPCEALSKGTPEMRKNHLPSLVGGNEQMVGENAIAFSCSEAGNFHLAAGSQTFSGREELLCGVVCTKNLNPNVLMMKSAQDSVRTYDAGSLNRTRNRRIFV